MSPFTSSATAPDTALDNDTTADGAAACPTSRDNNSAVDDICSSPNAHTRPSAQSTATGFVSPLTIVQNDQRSSNKPSGAIDDKYSMITSPRIDAEYSIKIDQAREKTKRSFDRSKLLENDECAFPRFEIHELTLGKVLGQGGFGTVIEIKVKDVIPPPQDDMDKKYERIVFDINEVEEERTRRKSECTTDQSIFHHGWLRGDANFVELHRKQSIPRGWRLRRDATLVKSRSNDGCEGTVGNHDQDIQQSKSHDCIHGEIVDLHDRAADVLTAGVKGGKQLQGEIVDLLDSASDVLTAGAKGGKQLGRDAFRKNHKHHGGIMEHPEQGEHETQKPRYELQKSASHDESRTRNTNGFMGVDKCEPSQKVSSNFSFLSWRDSKAGAEGNDAESPKEIMRGLTGDGGKLAKQEACYAIKLISQSIIENDFQKFLQAAKDLATETYFLSVLDHPHILKLRAVGQGDMFSPSWFLVLDRLHNTLFGKIEGTWKTQLDDLENSIFVWDRATKLRTLWRERMRVMQDLAGALSYLHDKKIIYRDLKPDNVGFDNQGKVKLFDFGLAREVHDNDNCGNGTYKLTPNTGSLRYMAPEVGNKWPYSFLADSYSFGILLWEVAALERPYNCFTPKDIRDMVMKWGERPKTKDGWSERVVELLKSSWDSNFRKRPAMKEIEAMLEEEVTLI